MIVVLCLLLVLRFIKAPKILVLFVFLCLVTLTCLLIFTALTLVQNKSLILATTRLGRVLLRAFLSFLIFILHLLPAIVVPLFFGIGPRRWLLLPIAHVLVVVLLLVLVALPVVLSLVLVVPSMVIVLLLLVMPSSLILV